MASSLEIFAEKVSTMKHCVKYQNRKLSKQGRISIW